MDTNQDGFSLRPDLKRAPQPQGNHELAALNQMLQQLNQPDLELLPGQAAPQVAPQVTPQAEFSAPTGANGATLALADPVFGEVSTPTATASAPVAPAPAPAAPLNMACVMLTGRSGVGKDWLAAKTGAAVLKVDSILREISEEVFGRQPEAAIAGMLGTLLVWGRGVVSAKFPITPARLAVTAMIHSRGWRGFGTPTFWTDRIIAATQEFGSVIVPGVTDPEDFKRLAAVGFTHFHVVCSNPTFAQRPKSEWVDNSMAIHLDRQIQGRISSPGQEKLRVIWSDTARCPSNRFYSVDEWLALYTQVAAVTGE